MFWSLFEVISTDLCDGQRDRLTYRSTRDAPQNITRLQVVLGTGTRLQVVLGAGTRLQVVLGAGT